MNRFPLRPRSLVWLLVFLLVIPAFAAMDEDFGVPDEAAFPNAEELLDSVVTSLPAVPVNVEARIISKTLRGEIDRKLNAEMLLDWYGPQPFARYTVRDAFGETLEELQIVRPAGPAREIRYLRGDPPQESELPDLYERIEGTDISWIDLSLAYLWWPGGTTVGAEPVKGRFCYIVDLPAPEGDKGEYEGVRLWIDAQINILLQAAAYDSGGQLVKLLEVKSFKKIGDVWIIQNLDVQSFPKRHKTSLRVRGADVIERMELPGGS